MHIRERGNKVIFIRSWWDKDLKKTIRKQIASCPLVAEDLPGRVRANTGSSLGDIPVEALFSPQEIAQAIAWFSHRQLRRQSKARLKDRLESPDKALSSIKCLTAVIRESGVAEIGKDKAFALLSAIVDLVREFKRVNVTKAELKAQKKHKS